MTSPAWFRLFLQQRRARLAANAQFFLCAANIMLVTFYHSPYVASSYILASNDTQPPLPLLSEVDSGRGAGWEMRRCKRKRRRIRPGILSLRERSCYQRLFRKVRRPWASRSLVRIGADATRPPDRSHFSYSLIIFLPALSDDTGASGYHLP